MARLYKDYLKLFEAWPIDVTKKGGRDFGEHLRLFAKETFGRNKKITATEEAVHVKGIASLKRLSDDYYIKKYPRTSKASATGLNSEECNIILSQEVLDTLQRDSRGIFSKVFGKDKEKD